MKTNKTILILSDWFLPGYLAGGPIQSIATLTAHLKENINFKIITRDRDFKASEPYETIQVNEWTEYQGRQVFYVSPSCMNPGFILQLIQQTPHDSLYLNSLFSKLFTIYPLKWKQRGAIKSSIILAPRGMLRDGALAVKPIKKHLFLTYAKLTGLFKEVHWQSTSVEETKEIRKRIGAKAQVTELSNLPAYATVMKPIPKIKGTLRLCFVARVVEIKNLHFAIEVLKYVTPHRIQFDIYGPKEDKRYWKTCEANSTSLPKNITLNYLGVLKPENIGKTIGQYHALFLPTKTENFGHSIVEALQIGRPVIISNQTPWRHLSKENVGFDLDLNNITAFSDAIQHLAELHQEEFNSMCNNSAAFIQQKLNIQELTLKYITLFNT